MTKNDKENKNTKFIVIVTCPLKARIKLRYHKFILKQIMDG